MKRIIKFVRDDSYDLYWFDDKTNEREFIKTVTKMDKYYTPEIEEFHVGFEYEWLNISNSEWLKKTHSSLDCSYNSPERTRVKYLDREDIESLGFIPIIPSNIEDKGSYEPDWWSTTKTGDGYQILKCKNYSTNEITYEISYGQHEYRQVKFDGTIKNKSELKKLLKQLGI